MTDEQDEKVLRAATWLMQTARRDDDVKLGIASACAARGHADATEFAIADSEGFLAIVEALQDMVGQIPVEETKALDGRSLR